MKRRAFLAATLLALFVLAACSGDYRPPSALYRAELPFTVVYTYPTHLAQEFPVTGSILVGFNHDLHPDTNAAVVRLQQVAPDGTLHTVPVEVFVTGANLIVTPVKSLDPLRRYELTVSADIRDAEGAAPAIPAAGFFLAFDTLAEHPLANRLLDVTSTDPAAGDDQIFDFHTFRVHFSEPLDRRTVINGQTFQFAGEDGNLVEGTIFVRATQLVFDPDEDLAPGQYTMTLTGGIKDVNGESLRQTQTYEFTVRTSEPRKNLTVENCPTLGKSSSCEPFASEDRLPLHPLTGEPTNTMLVDSLLLGATKTFVSGQLAAEMGNPGNDPSAIPLVIRKGQRLYATSIDSRLGGQIPTGLATGNLTITVLADSIGFLQASEATTPVAAGKPAVALTLDASITTESIDASMLMAQNILGVRLYGTATVDPETDRLIMDIAETLPVTADTEPPMLRMTSPTPLAERVRLGSAIHVLFDEPVTPASAKQTIRLRTVGGDDWPIDVLTNGAKVLIAPREPLDPDTKYRIVIAAGLADINGNQTAEVIDRSFTTGAVEWSAEPPIVGTTSPGMGASDALPHAPGHVPVEIWFSQVMDPDSIVLGESFRVEDLSTGGDVAGTLIRFFERIAFYPNEPFAAGHYYRVTLTDDITSYGGVKLSLLRDHNPGGPGDMHELWIDFLAIERNRWVPLRLQLDPVADVDGSGFVEDGVETVPDPAANFFAISNPLMPEPMYASGYMVGYAKGLDFTDDGQPFVDIELISGISMTATSTQIDLGGLFPGGDKAGFFDLFDPMGRILIDLLGPGDAPAVEGPHNTTEMQIAMRSYINVDNEYINYLLNHTLPLEATGELSFSPDGLMVVDITGDATMRLNLQIPFIGITIPLPLPTDVNLRAVSRNALAWWNAF
jgi:hypothetical protein